MPRHYKGVEDQEPTLVQYSQRGNILITPLPNGDLSVKVEWGGNNGSEMVVHSTRLDKTIPAIVFGAIAQ
jgi:hypothetical protein